MEPYSSSLLGKERNLFTVSMPVPKICEDSLQDLQHSIQTFDDSFQFTWDAELTILFTTKYLRQAADKINEHKHTLNKTLQPLPLGPSAHDNTLKAKELELQDRENRIRSQEHLFSTERIGLDLVKQGLEEEKHQNAEEKKAIQANYQKLIEEKEKIQVQMQKLDEKYAEIKKLLSEIDHQRPTDLSLISDKDLAIRYQDLERQKSDFEKEKQLQLSNFLKIEAGLSERDHNLEEKKHHLQLLAESLHKLKLELTQHHAKVSDEMDSQFVLLQEQEKELESKKKEMEATIDKLSEELKLVEKLKTALMSNVPAQMEILTDLDLQKKTEDLLEREIKVKKDEDELVEREKRLNEKARFFESAENMKDELERVQMLYQDMESEYENREIASQTKARGLELKEKLLLSMENSDTSALQALSDEIKENLKKMDEDEQKLLKAQDFVMKEKEELGNSTKMLQGIFQELTIQRQKLMEDQLSLELEKEKFVDIVGRLEQESNSISENEETMGQKIMELQQKELELEKKELSLLKREKKLLESN